MEYMLQMDRLTLRLSLLSIVYAVRHRRSILVDHMQVEGLRFKTYRNHRGDLNLWAVLNLPDDDVNVGVVMQHAHHHGGGLGGDSQPGDDPTSPGQMIAPLPAISTA